MPAINNENEEKATDPFVSVETIAEDYGFSTLEMNDFMYRLGIQYPRHYYHEASTVPEGDMLVFRRFGQRHFT